MATATESLTQFVGFFRRRYDDLTVFEVHGVVTPARVVSLFRQFLANPTPFALWDMRGCSISSFEDAELRWVVGQLVQLEGNGRKRVNGRSAFVCPRDADAAAMRKLIACAEADDYGIHLAHFRDIDDARCWLAEL